MKKLILLLSLSTLSVGAYAEDFLYILSARAKLLSAPSFNAAVVRDVTKGEKLVSLEKTQRWFRVSYKGKEGWISRLAVSPHPPMKRKSRLASADVDLKDSSRRRASAIASTAAVRGLREDGRARLSDDSIADYGMLARMENVNISDNEVHRFSQTK
ncbi:MAG: SH3 domain-containing protein [Gammaproteobacteria bacterium]|nr:SH3 domain-containing protein [Gammaproteobacteria bacterium]